MMAVLFQRRNVQVKAFDAGAVFSRRSCTVETAFDVEL